MVCVVNRCCRSFVQVCHEALMLNSRLINAEQQEYHESLIKNYRYIVTKLEDMFSEQVDESFRLFCLCQLGFHHGLLSRLVG